MSFPVIHLKGTTYEQGVVHGRYLQERISHNIALYFDRFRHEAQINRAEVLSRARLYKQAIADTHPAYFEGMRGIAAGSGQDLDEIVAINIRYEILYYQVSQIAMAAMKDGCTSFAVSPEDTTTGHLLMGQNWDWIPGIQGAVLHSTDEDGMESIAFTEAGIFGGKIGLNSTGLGLAVNGITTTEDGWTALQAPYHVRCFDVLRCWDLATAVAAITGTPRACSANYLIAQAPDKAVNIEAAPQTTNQIGWQNGCIVHTNHFVDPEKIGVEEPPYERRASSLYRLARMRELIEQNKPVSTGNLKQFLQDRSRDPDCICRVVDPALPEYEQYTTITGVVMDLEEKVMHLTDGPPHSNHFQTVRLN
jgi:isopenicillin-N N-acyltransferase-like protein